MITKFNGILILRICLATFFLANGIIMLSLHTMWSRERCPHFIEYLNTLGSFICGMFGIEIIGIIFLFCNDYRILNYLYLTLHVIAFTLYMVVYAKLFDMEHIRCIVEHGSNIWFQMVYQSIGLFSAISLVAFTLMGHQYYQYGTEVVEKEERLKILLTEL